MLMSTYSISVLKFFNYFKNTDFKENKSKLKMSAKNRSELSLAKNKSDFSCCKLQPKICNALHFTTQVYTDATPTAAF